MGRSHRYPQIQLTVNRRVGDPWHGTNVALAPKVELNDSELFVSVGHEVAFAVDDDGGSFDPLGAVLGDPGSCGPLADVVSTGENAGSLDVADLHNVLVLGEHVAQLLAGGTVSHGAVDVLQNFGGVSWSIAQKFLDFFADTCRFHVGSLLSFLERHHWKWATAFEERGR